MPLPSRRKRQHSPEEGGAAPQRVLSDETSDQNGSSNNVKVVVRVRPENQAEIDGNSRTVVSVMNENVLVFDPKEQSSPGYGSSRKRPRDLRKRQNRDLKFAFDSVFGPGANNLDLYKQTTKSVLDGLLNGYNCSVFAYGATGAGKTHTMLGNKEHPGVMYYTMMDLYNRIETLKDVKLCEVAISYLEVYNEQIRDLLMTGGSLPIREDPSNGVVVPGLSLHKPTNAEELLYMLQFGNTNRTQHPTDANAESSRSHAVFQVFVRQKDRTANISTEVRIAKMCLVDLAGSERATVTKNRGSRFREGANINRSLLALGNVINALAENKNKGHIPYRDSKLTRLLKDSLGGNCQTVMIAAVSPSNMSYEDTYNTLRYADRAKHIKATLKKNVLNVDFHVARYGQIVAELRKEIEELKSKVKGYEEGTVVSQNSLQVDNYSSFQTQIRSVYASRLVFRSEQLKQEILLRETQWQIYRKERCLGRLVALSEPSSEETVQKVRQTVKNLREKSLAQTEKRETCSTQLDQHKSKLQELNRQLDRVKCDGQLPEVLSLSVQVQEMQTTVQDSSQQLKYLKKVVRGQERELQGNERMLLMLLQLVKQQHYIIKGHNMMTSDLREQYNIIQKRVEGRELSWADQSQASSGFDNGWTFADMLNLPSLSSEVLSPMPESAVSGTFSSSSLVSLPIESDALTNSETTVKQSPPKTRRLMNTTQPPSTLSQPSRVEKTSGEQSFRDILVKGQPTPVKSSDSNSDRLSSCTPVHAIHSAGTENGASTQKYFRFAGHTPAARKALPLPQSSSDACQHDVDSKSVVKTATSLSETDSTYVINSSAICQLHLNDTFSRTDTCILKPEDVHSKKSSDLNSTFTLEEVGQTDTVVAGVQVPVVPSVNSNVCTNSKTVAPAVTNLSSVSDGAQTVIPSNTSSVPELQQKNSNVINQNHSIAGIQCGSQVGNQSGENDEAEISTESTLVNSLCSVSTLCSPTYMAGVDLSYEKCVASKQNVSTESEKSRSQVNTATVTKSKPLVPSQQASGNGNNVQSLQNDPRSQTVTKAGPSIVNSLGTHEFKSKGTAVRAIQFDSKENLPTPVKEMSKSYAEVVRTPTPERRSLREIGNSNTPLSTPLSPLCSSNDGFSSMSNSDSDRSLEGRHSGNISTLTQTRLFEKTNNEVSQKNTKNLNILGMPSLASNIITADKPKLRRMHSFTPRYMQSTKAHRIKNNTSRSAVSSGRVERQRKGSSSPINTRPSRTLLPNMRSKSMSNLAGRVAWQI